MSGHLARERAGVAGAAVSRAVVRATAQESGAASRKHLDYLVHCTHEINVSIPHLADALLERTASQSWMVVFKALIATHHLMMYGSERFIQHLSSRSSLFNINTFLEKGQFQGYDASIFMRCYSRYLNEKALSYRLVSLDLTKVKRGSDGVMRTMSVEKLLKTLPIVQSQLDALLDFEVTPSDLTSGVVHDAFMLLFRDSVRLFAAYNEGVINLLEKYFDMKKSQCTEALEIYTQFLSRMTRLSEFLKVSEAPSTLSEALQHHLVSLEKRRAKESSSCSSSNLSCTEETQRGADAEKDKIVLMKDQHLRDSSIQTPAVSPVGHSVGSSSSSSSTSDQMPTLSNTNGIMSSFTNGHFEQLSLGLSAPPTNHQPNSSAWGGSFLKPPPLTGQVPNTGIHVSLHTGAKLLGGDLDSSLASLVGNLHFGGAPAKKQDLPFEKKPVGGSGCTPSWQSKHTAALWGHTPSAPAPSSAPHMNGIIYTGYAPAPVALPMMAPQVPVYSMVPPQMGQMSSVPVMAPPPVIYNQPILRTTHPFGPVPGAQMHFM